MLSSEIPYFERQYHLSAAESVGAVYSGGTCFSDIPPKLAESCSQELLYAYEPVRLWKMASGTTVDRARELMTCDDILLRRALDTGMAIIGPGVMVSSDGYQLDTNATAGIWVRREEFWDQ